MRLALAVLAFAAAAAQAQVLFKWIDAQGQVHYGDRLPKGFKGTVVRIDAGPPADPVAPAVPATSGASPPVKPAPPPAAKPETMMEIAARRRATRERLQAAVDAARARRDEAQAALRSGGAPADDERQVIQQAAGAPGTLPASARSNCRKVENAQGKEVVMCPAVIPNPQYYERIRELEAAVAAAERDLDRAREAYRRGVD